MTAPAPPAMADARALAARGAIALAALAAIHLAVLEGQPDLAVAFLLWGLAAVGVLGALRAAGRKAVLAGLLALVLAALGVLQAVAPAVAPQIALVLPPTLGNLAVSGLFAYTLLPGHEPAIVRVARISRGEPPPEPLAGHARRVTWVWAVLPALIAAAALAALALGGIHAWSWIANVANPAILCATFLGEHLYRGWTLPQFGRPSLLWTVRVMLDRRAWPLRQPGHV